MRMTAQSCRNGDSPSLGKSISRQAIVVRTNGRGHESDRGKTDSAKPQTDSSVFRHGIVPAAAAIAPAPTSPMLFMPILCKMKKTRDMRVNARERLEARVALEGRSKRSSPRLLHFDITKAGSLAACKNERTILK